MFIPLRGSYYNQIKVLYDYNELRVLTHKTIKIMNNRRKVSIADIINIRKMIKVHLAYLANKKLLFRLDNGYIEEFNVPTSSIYSISRYKILEDNSICYRRTIKDVKNVIKVINILTDWLNGEEILYINDEYKTTKILESVPLISTLTTNQYKTFKI